MKRFLTLFPDAENVHLTKDVGMIPYTLHRHFGYSSTLACYKNGQYPYLESEVKGLNIVFIKKITGNKFIDSLVFLLVNIGKYDILQVYHLERSSTLLLTFFKVFTLNRGITYLKLDADERILNHSFKSIQARIHKFLISKITCVSIENKFLQERLVIENTLGRPVIHIANGYYDGGDSGLGRINKQKKIITVGRIGTYQKYSEVILKAFAVFSESDSEWTLELIGTVEPDFNCYLEHYFLNYPQLKKRVLVSGFISDKKLLANKYDEASVFVLTSRFESVGLVLLDAMYAGCHVISSDILAARYITDMGKYGNLFDVGDFNQLANLLSKSAVNMCQSEKRRNLVRKYAKENFSWPMILKELNF